MGDFESDRDSITYSGLVSMSGNAMGNNGQVLEIGFDVDVDAKVEYEWESDEEPTGWNHSTDSPTYTSSLYASGSDVMVNSVAFTPESPFIIHNEEVPFQEVNKYIQPTALKQLLNPAIYSSALAGEFQKRLENLEPPEYDPGDDYEPDYDDRDY